MIRLRLFSVLFLSAVFVVSTASAQNPPLAWPSGSLLDRIMTQAEPHSGAWTAEQITTMSRLRDEAMNDPYAYSQLAYLADGIGPRLDWVIAGGCCGGLRQSHFQELYRWLSQRRWRGVSPSIRAQLRGRSVAFDPGIKWLRSVLLNVPLG